MPKKVLTEKMIKFLNENFNIPTKCIEKNVHLSEFEEGLTDSVDMLVSYLDEEGFYTPILIIECVEDEVLSNKDDILKTLDKLAGYDEIIGASRLLIASEGSMALVRWDDNAGEYVDEDSIPTYEAMGLEVKAMLKAQEEMHGHDCNCSNEGECGGDCGCSHHE